MRQPITRLGALALGLLLAPNPSTGHVGAGEPVEPAELATLDGRRLPLLARDRPSLLVFFRPGQERSRDLLERMAECEKKIAGMGVYLVAVAPASAPQQEVAAAVAESGLRAPVLLDEEDALYGKLELRQHPVSVIVDRHHKVAAVEPYQRLRYCEIVVARLGFLLGQTTRAELEKVLNPPRAAFPAEVAGGHGGHYVNLGKKALAKGDCAHAVQAFDHALELDPGNADALAGKATCEARAAKQAPAPKK
jgi:hypothetical protein